MKLGSFRIESVLGSGAMGVVYRATNEKSGPAAVKVVSGEFAQGSRSRPVRARGNSSSSAIPTSCGFSRSDGSRNLVIIAMEYVEGETLERIIQERRLCPGARSSSWGSRSVRCPAVRPRARHRPPRLEALQPDDHGQQQRQVDRLRDRQGSGRRPRSTATGRTLGTAAYMAPSRSAAPRRSATRPTSTPSGSFCFQALTGRPPYRRCHSGRRSCTIT